MKKSLLLLDPLPLDGNSPAVDVPTDLLAFVNQTSASVHEGGIAKVDLVSPAPQAAPVVEQTKPQVEPQAKPQNDTPLTLEQTIQQSLENDKLEAEQKQQEQVKPADVTPQLQRKPGTRDFAGIDEPDIQHFKNMSIQAFDRLVPLYHEAKRVREENATLKRERDELSVKAQTNQEYKTILDHDDGYVLTEEYRNAERTVSNMETEVGFWQTQLQNIIEGKDWQELQRDPKTLQYFAGPAKKPTAGDQARVTGLFNRAAQLHNQAEANIQITQQRFNQRRAAINENMRKGSDAYFPFYKTLATDEKHPHNPYYKEAMTLMAPELRGHPLADMLAKSWAAIKVLTNQVEIEKKRSSVRSDASRGGPSSDANIAPGAGEAKSQEVTLDMFEKYKRGEPI